jgi:hypothetical protein
MGTLFAVTTSRFVVARLDETANVKFRASTLKFLLALDDQEPLLGMSAPKEPFGQSVSPKRSVGAEKQNEALVGSCAALSASRNLEVMAQNLTYGGSSNQTTAQLPMVVASNMPSVHAEFLNRTVFAAKVALGESRCRFSVAR